MDGMTAGPPHRLPKCSNSVVGSLIICRRRDVPLWHKADIAIIERHIHFVTRLRHVGSI